VNFIDPNGEIAFSTVLFLAIHGKAAYDGYNSYIKFKKAEAKRNQISYDGRTEYTAAQADMAKLIANYAEFLGGNATQLTIDIVLASIQAKGFSGAFTSLGAFGLGVLYAHYTYSCPAN